MTTLELKKEIKSRIDKIEDEKLLKKVENLLNEKIYVLSEEQIKAVEEAREEFSKGEFYTQEEIEEMTNKWLENK